MLTLSSLHRIVVVEEGGLLIVVEAGTPLVAVAMISHIEEGTKQEVLLYVAVEVSFGLITDPKEWLFLASILLRNEMRL